MSMELASKNMIEFSVYSVPHQVNAMPSAPAYSDKGRKGQLKQRNNNKAKSPKEFKRDIGV